MIKAILYKWFGLEYPVPCDTCEVLREQLAHSEAERRALLNRLLDGNKTEPPVEKEQELIPIRPQFMPWRVRQQMLEAEDKKRAQLLKDKEREAEIAKLEEQLGIAEGK